MFQFEEGVWIKCYLKTDNVAELNREVGEMNVVTLVLGHGYKVSW